MKNLTCLLAWTMIVLALMALQCLAQSTYEPYTFTTLAGNAGFGSADGTRSAAQFWGPSGVAVDSTGNVYVADTVNCTIRKVTPAGVVTTLAGLAQLDDNGNSLYGSADGTGSAARFAYPQGVAVDNAGNVYVADTWNHAIRKVTSAGLVTTFAGLPNTPGSSDGTGSAARFYYPTGVAVDSAGNTYVADSSNATIRKVTPTGVVTTLAGLAQFDGVGNPVGGSADGTGSAARFRLPRGVAVDRAGNVYVADTGNSSIRKVTPAGVVTTLAGLAGSEGGADGTGNAARFAQPFGVALDSTGNVYVADTAGRTIRKLTPTGVVTTLAGLAGSEGSLDEIGSAARFAFPSSVAVDSADNVYVADSDNHTIRKVTPEGVVTTLAGLAGSLGNADGTGSEARFNRPSGVAVDGIGNLYVADTDNASIRKVTPTGVVTTLAGGSFGGADGTGSNAQFGEWHERNRGPSGVAVDNFGNVYVADPGNQAIRKVTPAGVVTTLAGGHRGSTILFAGPSGVAVDSAGNVYVADPGQTILKVTQAGVVTTLAGLADAPGSADEPGSSARFYQPTGVAVDSLGNVYVADESNHTVRKVNPAGVVTTLVGLAGSVGNADGTGSAARFSEPHGVAVDSAGNLYVADSGNNTIRKGYPAPRILNSGPGFGFNGGLFGFNLTGPAGQSVVIEASTELVSWRPLWTNTFTFPVALNFSDPQSGVSSNRFYRARLP